MQADTVALITLEEVEIVKRKLRSDGDERGMLIYGYKFRPVMGARIKQN